MSKKMLKILLKIIKLFLKAKLFGKFTTFLSDNNVKKTCKIMTTLSDNNT